MVYTGKPSKACARCRERRIKCDFGRPGCQKCQNAGVECPGYRNEQDLLFKNVTGQVIRRHNAATASSRPPKHSSPASSSSSTKHASQNAAHHKHHTSGVSAVSMTFLFESYLRGSSFNWVRGLYDTAEPSSLLAQVVEATALAAYSHESHRKRLLEQARIAYEKNLIRLREVIIAPGPITNSTLASILLMSRFETLLADGTDTSVTDSWTGHIAGAFSVIESRSDTENFGDPLSFRLAEQTVHNYNMWCLRAREGRPQSLLAVTEKLRLRLDDSAENASLRRLRLKQHGLSEAFVLCRELLFAADLSSVRTAVATAAVLDDQVQEFCQELATVSGYDVRPVHELQHNDRKIEFEPQSAIYHLYQSHHAARMWNNVRMLVVTVSYDLMDVASRVRAQHTDMTDDDLDEELDITIGRCKEVIATMCDQVCDSAPQYLCPGTRECTHASASYLAWPLFVVARVSADHARFARDALFWIGDEFNIKSATQAAQGLNLTTPYDDWLLACYMF